MSSLDALVERHLEATAKADRLQAWLGTEATKVRSSLEFAIAQNVPDFLEQRDREFEQLKVSAELVTASVIERDRAAIRLVLVNWARESISPALADLMLRDESTAEPLEAFFVGVLAILATHNELVAKVQANA